MYDLLYFALFAYFDFQKSWSELQWKFTFIVNFFPQQNVQTSKP